MSTPQTQKGNTMDMYTVLDSTGRIIARSRLIEVAAQYMTIGTILLCNGKAI